MAKSYENKVVLSFEVDTKAAEQQLTKMFKMSEKLSEQEQEERVAYALKAWNKILDMYAKNTDKIKGYNISSDLAGINLQLRDPSKITDAQAFVDKIATLYESIQTIIDSTTKSTAGIFSTIDQSKQNKTIKDIQNLRDWYTRRANKTTTYEIDTNGNYVLDDGNRKRTYKEVSNPGYYRNISVRNEGAESNGWQELRPSDVMAEIKSMPEYQKALDKVGKEHAEALMKALGITDQNVINEYLDNITAYNTLMSQMNVKYDAKNKSFYIDKARINSNPELKGLTGEKRLQKYTEIYGGMERYIPMLQFLQDQIKTMENGFSGFDKLETEDKANAISTDPTRWVNEGLVKDFFSQYQTLFENTLDNMFTELRKQIKIQTNQILGEAAKASTERANKKFATYSDKYMSGIDSTTGNGVGGNATNVDEGNQNGSESTTESVSGIEKKTTKFDQFAVSVEGATKAVQELMKAYVEIDKKANEEDVSNELYDKLDNQRKEIMKNIAIYEGIFEKYEQIPNFKELIKSNKQFADVENFESIMDYVTEPTKEEASFSHYDETTYNKWYAAQDKTKKVKNEIDVDDVYLQNLANVVGYSREISESVEHVQSQMQETAEIAKQTGEKTTSAVDETNEAVKKTKDNVDALNKSLGNISDESIKAITDAFKELNEQVKSIVEQINKFNDNLKVGNTKVNVQEKSGVKSEINSDASNDIKTIATNSKKLDDIKKALDEVKASIDKCCEIKKDSNGKELTPEELSKLANASKKIGELSDEVSKQNFSININSAKVDTESFVNSILDQLKDINIPINISPNINSNNTTGHVYTAYDALIDRVYANILNHNATTNKNGVRYHDDRANLIEKKDEKGNVTDSIWATRHGNNITDAYADRREAMIVASSRHNVMSTPYVNGSSESVPAELEEAILQDAMKRYGLKKEDFDISMHTHPAEFASFSWDGGTNTSGDIPHDLLRPYIKTAIVAANKEIAMLHLDKIPKAKLEEAMKNGLDLYNNPDRENEHKQLEDSIWNQYSTYNAERFYNGFKNGAFSYSKDSNFISQNLVKLLNENGIKNVEKYQNTDFVKTIFDDAVKRTSDGIDKNQIFKTVEDLESALLNNFKQEFSNNLKGVTLPKDKLNEISEAIWNTVFKVDTVTGDGFVGSLDHQPFADITKEDFKAIQERETLKREITKLGYDANKVYEVLPIEEFKKKYQYHGLSDSIIGNGTSNNQVDEPATQTVAQAQETESIYQRIIKLLEEPVSITINDEKLSDDVKQAISSAAIYPYKVSIDSDELSNNIDAAIKVAFEKIHELNLDITKFTEAVNNAVETTSTKIKETSPIVNATEEKQKIKSTDELNAEIEQLGKLEVALGAVQKAIQAKTDAFTLEGTTVNEVIAHEVQILGTLADQLGNVFDAMQPFTMAVEALGKVDLSNLSELMNLKPSQIKAMTDYLAEENKSNKKRGEHKTKDVKDMSSDELAAYFGMTAGTHGDQYGEDVLDEALAILMSRENIDPSTQYEVTDEYDSKNQLLRKLVKFKTQKDGIENIQNWTLRYSPEAYAHNMQNKDGTPRDEPLQEGDSGYIQPWFASLIDDTKFRQDIQQYAQSIYDRFKRENAKYITNGKNYDNLKDSINETSLKNSEKAVTDLINQMQSITIYDDNDPNKKMIEEFLTSMTSQFADARSRISNSQSTSANNQRDKYIDQFRTLLGQYQKINEKGVNSELSLMDTHKLSESSDKLAEIINQVRALGDSVEDVNGTIDMLQQEWNDVDKIIKTTRDDAEAKKQADEETKLKNERETNVKNAITSAQTASKNSVMAQRQFVSTARGIDKTTDSLENLSPTAVQNVVDATTEYNKQRQALIDLKEQYKNYDDIVAQIDKVLNDMDTEQKQVTESMNTQGTKMQAENKLVQDLIDAYKKYYDIKSKALNGKATDTEVETAKANVDKLQSEVDSIKSDLSNDVLNNLSTQMSNIENNFEDKRELKIISDLTEAWKKYYETKKKALSNSATDEQVDEAKNNIALAEAPYNQIKDRLTQEQREKIGNTISGYKTDYEQTRAKRGDIEMQKQEYKELTELYNQFLKARKNVITGNDDKNNTQLQLANNLLTQIIEKKKEINQLGLTDVDIEKSLAQQLGFQLKQTKQRQDMTNTQRAESKFNQINNGVYGYLYNIQQYESGDITLAQNGQLQRYVGNVDDAIKLLDKVNNTLSNGDNA